MRARRVCSWCKKDLGLTAEDTYEAGAITHGICTDCDEALRKQYDMVDRKRTREQKRHSL